MPIQNVKNFELNNASFSTPKKLSNGKYFISIDVSNEPLMFQLTKIKAQFTDNSSELFLTPELGEFVKDMEEQVVTIAKKHKETWFPGKEIDDTFFDTAIMPALKVVKKQGTLKAQINESCMAFNSAKEEIERTEISSDSNISTIINISGIWFTKTRFGLSWKVAQIKLHGLPKPPKGQCLFDDDDEDDHMDEFPEGVPE